MKSKRSKYLPIIFLLSFFFSFGANVVVSANIRISQFNEHSKSLTHLHEKVLKADLNELLIEENENEDEVDFDVVLHFIPYFLEITPLTAQLNFEEFKQEKLLKSFSPIYINTCNFRI